MREETAKRAKKEQQTDRVKRWSAQGRTADLSGDMSRSDLKKFDSDYLKMGTRNRRICLL